MIPHIPDRYCLARLTTREIAALDPERTLVVLPVAAVEQHGPHLPVLTDTIIAEAVLTRALALRPDDGRVWALPVQAYGKSNEHTGFPGTFALSAETLAHTLREIAHGVHASGLRRLLFLNSHGGNPEIVDYVARDLRQELGILCFTAHPFRFGLARAIISDVEGGYGIHGGEAETSVVLAVAPELVHPEHYTAELPPVRHWMRHFTLKGAASFGWLTRDLSRTGTIGDPRTASAEKGQAILDAEARLVAELIEETLALQLEPPA
ncbi:MAG TPA: creatininase family protein [Chloroflexota bacterium]|jgi:creatinine amidohydrolase/Fe(II)-dependent formamide hydrolase-like protein|nr:creatininase family protein [Chloroflexota bacterium]